MQESGTKKNISKYSVHMGAARFQLTYMGPYLFREERNDPDPRVHHFIPDTWQVFEKNLQFPQMKKFNGNGSDLLVCNKF